MTLSKLKRIFLSTLFPLFFKTNPLHPDIFPIITQIECDIINMSKNLYKAYNGIGVVSSGGTESILLACYAYKNLGIQFVTLFVHDI